MVRRQHVHPGVQHGGQPGREVPFPGQGGRGDLAVQVNVVTPTDLSDDEAELLRQYAELRGEAVAPAETGLFSKIKSAFRS